AGWFGDLDVIAGAAAELSGMWPGVFVTLNPVDPTLLDRVNLPLNLVAEGVTVTTKDADIVCRTRLGLDFDAVRPDPRSSSTDAEHELALQRAVACRDWLHRQEWPAPMLNDSGNGGHLVYAINLPNDGASRVVLQRTLHALARRFDDDA